MVLGHVHVAVVVQVIEANVTYQAVVVLSIVGLVIFWVS